MKPIPNLGTFRSPDDRHFIRCGIAVDLRKTHPNHKFYITSHDYPSVPDCWADARDLYLPEEEHERLNATLEDAKEYWSKPEQLPPICWIMRHSESMSRLVVCVDPINEKLKLALGGVWISSDNLKDYRWLDRPFSKWEDGKECLVKGGDDD